MIFDFFKKRKDEKAPIGWGDITLGQFQRMQKLDTKDEDYLFKFAAIAYNIDIDEFYSMPLDKVNKYMARIQPMLSEQARPTMEKINSPHIVLNGREYEITGYDGDLTLAQYIDFQSSFKTYMDNMAEFISILLVPKGKKYNEGYSVKDVVEDIKAMPIGTAMGISRFFFLKWKRLSESSLTCTQRVLLHRLLRDRKTMTEDERTETEMALTALRAQRKQLQEMEREFGFK